jgi:EpsI family protein
VLWATAIVALAVATGPAFAVWHERRSLLVKPEVITNQLKIGGWTTQNSGSWHPIYGGADLEIMTRIAPPRGGAAPVDVAVVYYARNRESRSLLSSTNQLWDSTSWYAISRGTAEARLGPAPVHLNETLIASQSEQRLIWWTYWIDNRFTTSGLVLKLLQMKTAFGGNESTALVAFSIPVEGSVEDARARLQMTLTEISSPLRKPAGMETERRR